MVIYKIATTVTLSWCAYQITTTTITLMVRLSNNHNDNNTFHLLANRQARHTIAANTCETKGLNY